MKIESKGGFASIRTNNCIIKGKWIYEILLITNRLSQIGWSQLMTPFTTHNGVGDDTTSYACDGYRKVKWHSGKEVYGQLWDIGDVIGVGIDMEKREIEYFINGNSMGIAFTNIPVGENIAYFPSISFSAEERVSFNFGKSPLLYKYRGYDSIDVPDCFINNTTEITQIFLDILSGFLLDILEERNVSFSYKINLSSRIFSFLVYYTFSDRYLLRTKIIPFMCQIGTLDVFMKYLYIHLENKAKVEFTTALLDNICCYIEECGIRGKDSIEEWQRLIRLFTKLLSIDYIVQYWIDSNKYVENLRSVFNSNLVKNNDIYNHIKNKYTFTCDKSLKKILKEMKYDEEVKNYREMNQYYDIIYSMNFKQLLSFFLQDNRNFRNIHVNKEIKLKALVADLVNTGFEFVNPNDIMNLLGLNFNKKDYNYFYKNLVFNLFELLSDYYNFDFDKFSIEPWLNRSTNDTLYYDEVGIGGTISHVTSEFPLDEKYRTKNLDFYSDLNHRMIKLSIAVLAPTLKDYCNILEKVKNFNSSQRTRL
jgi:hypothetical protein